jgi:uncharacterized protein
MTASNLVSQEKSAADRKAYEPSMEEILASIRRIIADDQSFPSALAQEARPPQQAPVAAPKPPIAELPVHSPAQAQQAALESRWESEAAPIAPAPLPPSARLQREPIAAPPRLTRPLEHAPQEEVRPVLDVARRRSDPPPRAPEPEAPLVSPSTDQTVAGAFQALTATKFVQNQDAMADIVRAMLRPMLKAWLDDNLPIMVERLVRAEIERVARGGR